MDRDRAFLTDLGLHHVMTRAQVVGLGYFTSTSRANARLLQLRQARLLRRIEPSALIAAREHLYAVGRPAEAVLDTRVARLLAARSFTPRFIDHALATVNLRIALKRLGMTRWWAEPQVRHTYEVRVGASVRTEDFRPDGLALIGGLFAYVEVDRGNASRARIAAKFTSYRAYHERGLFAATFGAPSFAVLIATTGRLRKRHLLEAVPASLPFPVAVATEADINAAASFQEVVRP